MRFSEILRMALSSLGVNKLRSFLTMSGITIGVFSVIGVMTAVSAMRGSIESGLSFLGANMFQFAKVPNGIGSGGADRHKYDSRKNVTLAEAERYAALMADVSKVVCFKVFENEKIVQATYQNRKTTPGTTFGGSNEYFLTANQYAIGQGRNLTQADLDLVRPIALIGTDIVKKLYPSENPIGKLIKIGGHTYTVVGIFAERGSTFGQSQDDIVIVPITRFLQDFGAEHYTVNVATQSPDQATYYETMEKGITAMRIARHLRPDQDNDFELYSNDSLIEAFAKIADVVRAGAFVISAIALLAAGVGIMNIMLVSVTERTKEIGIRKSIGARKVVILQQFLYESMSISLAGGVAGIILGVIAGDIIAAMLSAAIVFPWAWALLGLGVCSVIGVGFGLHPAFKAASLDPIEALRFE